MVSAELAVAWRSTSDCASTVATPFRYVRHALVYYLWTNTGMVSTGVYYKALLVLPSGIASTGYVLESDESRSSTPTKANNISY